MLLSVILRKLYSSVNQAHCAQLHYCNFTSEEPTPLRYDIAESHETMRIYCGARIMNERYDDYSVTRRIEPHASNAKYIMRTRRIKYYHYCTCR